MATLTTNRKAALTQATIYYEGVVGKGNGENSDISRVDGVNGKLNFRPTTTHLKYGTVFAYT